MTETTETLPEAVRDEHLVPLPDRNCGMTAAKIERKGKRPGSLRRVTGTDRTKRGGYQLEGEFLTGREAELRTGDVVAQQDPDREWRIGIVMPSGTIGWTTCWTGPDRMPTVRHGAENALAKPLEAIARVVKDFHDERDECARTLEQAEKDLAGWEAGAKNAEKNALYWPPREDAEMRVKREKRRFGEADRRHASERAAWRTLEERIAAEETDREPLEAELRNAAEAAGAGKLTRKQAFHLAERLLNERDAGAE